MVRRIRSSAVTATLILTTVATAACGRSQAANSSNACTEPGVEPNSVTIGLLFPDTGPLADVFSPARAAVEARIRAANASGGINGRQIKIKWRDDQSLQAPNLSAAHDLLENSGVFGMIEATAAASGSADYLDAQGVPVTGLGAEAIWTSHRNMFAVTHRSADGPGLTTFGTYAKAQGGTRAFLLQSSANASSQLIGTQFRASLNAAGVPLVAQQEYTDGITSPATVAAAIRASDADVIAGATSGHALAEVLRAVRAAGIHVRVAFGPDGYDPSLLTEFGPAISGMSAYTTVTPFELKSPGVERYQAAMARYAPELSDPKRVIAVHSYIATDLFLHGLQGAGGCPSRATDLELSGSVSG
jgi:ABC-type branched-subunit amino acid transport system substrate-binding protein